MVGFGFPPRATAAGERSAAAKGRARRTVGGVRGAKPDQREGAQRPSQANGARRRSAARVRLSGSPRGEARSARGSAAAEPGERSEAAKRRASETVGESEGRSPISARERSDRARRTEE